VRYIRVNTERELIDRLSETGAVILCGGTDLLVKMRAGTVCPELLLDVSEMESLKGITEANGHVEIGAATTEAGLLAAPLIQARLPLLATVLTKLGSVQIRNRGTLGGNLVNASPAADSAIPLLLYDAELRIVGPDGERSISVEEFLVGPGRTSLRAGEFVRTVRIPVPKAPFRAFYHKVGKRQALTIAIASLGALVRLEGTRVAEARFSAGSVAPTALRLHRLEQRLRGADLRIETIETARSIAAESVSPIDDVRATAAYRRAVTGDLVARFLYRLWDRQ
jgi:CO/xanthine dehydrogenase FAD-binding subunit